MDTPKDNTEVIRMLRDVKNSIWKSITPMKSVEHNFNEYLSSLKSTAGGSSRLNPPNIATQLNFSGMEDCRTSQSGSFDQSFRPFETPETLKRKLMHTEVELQASKAKLKERESMISVMEPANKKVCLSLENKLEKYKKQHEYDTEKIVELEGKLKMTRKQIFSLKTQLNDIEKQKKTGGEQQELKLLSLQQECSNLKVELADVRSEKTEAIRKLNMEIGRLELKVSMLSEEAEKAQEYITSLKRQNSEMAEKVGLCNFYKDELNEALANIKVLENKIEADKDAMLIIASRQKDLKLLTELQKENRLLNEEVSKYKENNVMLYQEKMWSMQDKLAQAEKKCLLLAKLQVENEQLKSKVEQWEELFDDKSTPHKTPTAFSRKLSQYQQNEAVLTNKLSNFSSRCDILEKQKQQKEDTIKSLNHRLEQLQMSLSRQDSVLKRYQRKIIFLSQEKDNCRKLLDSYLSEATISGVALNAAQISHLEEMNAELKRTLEKSEKEIDDLNDKLKNYCDKYKPDQFSCDTKQIQSENLKLSTQIAELEKENAELKKHCSKQILETSQGATSGRILHLKFNPLESANRRHLEQFNKLQEENDLLKKRIKVLEEEGVEATDVTMKVQQKLEVEGADSTVNSLKEKLAASERKVRFILENARIKSTEFREAVYRLLGYRIDVPMAETYKLSHFYADSREDYLLFKINSEGIQLIETEYSQQVVDRMEMYLQQHDSFPAFLASLTLDLFNQQTFMLES